MTLPELVAHRGYRLHYPENTLIGIEAALRAGARFVEIDIQLSRDRVPILFHDADFNRICGVAGAVKDFTAEEIKKLRASEYNRFGHRYATNHVGTLAELTELLKRHLDVTVFVELKEESLTHFGITEVLARVRTALVGIEQRAVLISFEFDALLAARQGGWPNIGIVIDHWKDRRLSIVRKIAPQYVFCNVAGLPRFGKLHMENARLVVYEIDDAKKALRLFRRGVEMIETFAIGELHRDLVAISAA